ncbi:hypothetical protein OSTOST_10175, partial [Ostertagia ostertagi]
AVAERAKLKSYILLGCLVILIQALPAHWVWDSQGFFYKMGVVDFAGCSAKGIQELICSEDSALMQT